MDSESNAWVFDSLVGFLHGPVWNVPLQTFIEEKSLPFEPSDNGEILDKPEYKFIHEEYKNLILDQVDVMLGSFMEDIGITAEQFEAACNASAHALPGLPPHFHRRPFEQVWAANDYDIFVKMMTHKNVELQLQALELIERRFGAVPSVYTTETEDEIPMATQDDQTEDDEDWTNKDDVMTEIKKLQIEDKEDIKAVDPEAVVEEKKVLITKLQNVGKKEVKIVEPDAKSKNDIELQRQPPKKVEVTEEEIRVRQEYLKQQRDKLLALKKQVRERRLDQAGAQDQTDQGGQLLPCHPPPPANRQPGPAPLRPKSARAAAAVLTGAAPPSPAAEALLLRRALATRLKAEVVDGSH
ncbi:Cilia- and flagella-associated protein 36 [Eumeta japonica]|uniref:Cilia- and flagella-associated protein 36 n=1 Tax=Eumeta variegata TaxID=151549 RepID=A0A4C1SS13_EUMVA|nr:Cilia- and flagella-associated protein 36 [Eumeta japonica]